MYHQICCAVPGCRLSVRDHHVPAGYGQVRIYFKKSYLIIELVSYIKILS